MIVQPDILSHWKVRALCGAIGVGPALTALLGLWSHCQNSRAWIFALTPRMLAGICHYTEDPDHLLRVFLECKLLDELPDGRFEVHDWAEKNATLLRNWNAWSTKTKKETPKTPPKSDPKTDETAPEDPPKTVLRGGDKIREDKRRISLGAAGASQGEIPGLSPDPAAAAAGKSTRPPDPCFEALVELQGSTLSGLAKSERGRLNRALQEIREACPGVTAAEIHRRADAYRAAMPGATLTASALAAHWSRLAPSAPSPAAQKNEGGAARLFRADNVPPAPAGWEESFEVLYDLTPLGEWHVQQPDVREAILRHLASAPDPVAQNV